VSQSFSFFVPGKPLPWKRAGRDGRTGRTFTPAKVTSRKADVHIIGRAAMKAVGFKMCPKDEPVALSVCAYFKVPPGISAKERERRLVTSYHVQVPDADNITKLIKDALNAVVWADDSQVQIRLSEKRWSDTQEGVQVSIERLPYGRKS